MLPLYCQYKRENKLVMTWLLSRVKEDLTLEVRFKLYSLQVLL